VQRASLGQRGLAAIHASRRGHVHAAASPPLRLDPPHRAPIGVRSRGLGASPISPGPARPRHASRSPGGGASIGPIMPCHSGAQIAWIPTGARTSARRAASLVEKKRRRLPLRGYPSPDRNRTSIRRTEAIFRCQSRRARRGACRAQIDKIGDASASGEERTKRTRD
jgi:hypothetical protein